jgi:mycothiol synthase
MSDSPRSVDGWVTALAAAARSVDGVPPFSDGALVEYRTGARRLVAIDESAAALVSLPSVAEPASVAEPVEAEFVVHPDARGRGLGTRLLETLLGSTASPVLIWAHGDHPAARALAASHGLAPIRTLLHLAGSVPEPVEGPLDARPSTGSGTVSVFEVGRDEDEWVALNHRIFERHAEQGSITRTDLEQLEAEPWFEADDFLLLRDSDGVMIGYCWVKIEDALGEIYVLGISPDHQGEKLGGRLLDAGLARMRERGIHRAHLYVEGDNTQALPLYYSRGFERDSIDIQYSSAG